MTDTLKSDLNGVISALLEAGLGLGSTHVAAVEKAIAELDRLEAEVKKPRLPEGYDIVLRDDGNIDLAYEGQFGEWAAVIYSNQAVFRLLSAFLTTPDVVPSTEPVQAAGDTAGEIGRASAHTRADLVNDYIEALTVMEMMGESISDGKTYGIAASFLRNTLRERDRYFDEVVRLRKLKSGVAAPASPSDQGQRSQTPMNTETAEKPKPVSLADEVHRTKPRWAHGGVVHENEFYHALDVIDARLRTRGV